MAASSEAYDQFPEDAFTALEEARGTADEELSRTEFYSAGGNFLLCHPEHWWCRYPQLMTEMTRVLEFVNQQPSIDSLWRQMSLQLLACTACIDQLHQGIDTLKAMFEETYTPESCSVFFSHLTELEHARLGSALYKIVEPSSKESLRFQESAPALMSVLEQSEIPDVIGARLHIVYELLRYPLAMENMFIRELFCALLLDLQEKDREDSSGNSAFEIEFGGGGPRIWPGVYLLLMNPHPGIRFWSQLNMKRLGPLRKIDLEGEDNVLLRIVEQWMKLLEFDLFETRASQGPEALSRGLTVAIPTRREFWSSLNFLMMQADAHALLVLLEKFPDLVDIIFNHVISTGIPLALPSEPKSAAPEENDCSSEGVKLILQICRCCCITLDTLDYRVWTQTSFSPQSIVMGIFRSCTLTNQLVAKSYLEVLCSLYRSLDMYQAEEGEGEETLDGLGPKIVSFLCDLCTRIPPPGSLVRSAATQVLVKILTSMTTSPDVGNYLRRLPLANVAIWGKFIASVACSRQFHPSITQDTVKLVCNLMALHAKNFPSYLSLQAKAMEEGQSVPSTASDTTNWLLLPLYEEVCEGTDVANIPVKLHVALFDALSTLSQAIHSEELFICVNACGEAPENSLTSFHAEALSAVHRYRGLVVSYLARVKDGIEQSRLKTPLSLPAVVPSLFLVLCLPLDNRIMALLRNLLVNMELKGTAVGRSSWMEALLLLLLSGPPGSWLRVITKLLEFLATNPRLEVLGSHVSTLSLFLEHLFSTSYFLRDVLPAGHMKEERKDSGEGQQSSADKSTKPLLELIQQYRAAIRSAISPPGLSTSNFVEKQEEDATCPGTGEELLCAYAELVARVLRLPADGRVPTAGLSSVPVVRVLDSLLALLRGSQRPKSQPGKTFCSLFHDEPTLSAWLEVMMRWSYCPAPEIRRRSLDLVVLILEVNRRREKREGRTTRPGVRTTFPLSVKHHLKELIESQELGAEWKIKIGQLVPEVAPGNLGAAWHEGLAGQGDEDVMPVDMHEKEDEEDEELDVGEASVSSPVTPDGHIVDLTLEEDGNSASPKGLPSPSGALGASRQSAVISEVARRESHLAESAPGLNVVGIGSDGPVDPIEKIWKELQEDQQIAEYKAKHRIVLGLERKAQPARLSLPYQKEIAASLGGRPAPQATSVQTNKPARAGPEIRSSKYRPFVIPPPTTSSSSSAPEISVRDFHRQIMDWKVTDIQRPLRDLPELHSEFRTAESYVQAWQPLLFEEARAVLLKGWEECERGRTRPVRAKLTDLLGVEEFVLLDFFLLNDGMVPERGAKGRRDGGSAMPLFGHDVILLLPLAAGQPPKKLSLPELTRSPHFLGIVDRDDSLAVDIEIANRKKNRDNKANGGKGEKTKPRARHDDGSVRIRILQSAVESQDIDLAARQQPGSGEWLLVRLESIATIGREFVALHSLGKVPDQVRTTIVRPRSVVLHYQLGLHTENTKILLKKLRSLTTEGGSAAKEKSKQRSDEREKLREKAKNRETKDGFSSSEEQILQILADLREIPMTISILKETGAGIAMTNLKKSSKLKEVQRCAEELIAKWKQVLNEEEDGEGKDGGKKESPKASSLASPAEVPQKLWDKLKDHFNASQMRAVHAACSGPKQRASGFTLLQGPPGTGKTKTILGILSAFLGSVKSPEQPTVTATPAKRIVPGASLNVPTSGSSATHSGRSLSASPSSTTSSSFSSNHPRILLCAPSNGAVDELVLRILRDGLYNRTGANFKPVLVRLGHIGEDAHEVVRGCALEVLVEKQLGNHPSQSLLSAVEKEAQELREKLDRIGAEISRTSESLYSGKSSAPSQEVEEGEEDGSADMKDKLSLLHSRQAALSTALSQCTARKRDAMNQLRAARDRLRRSTLSSASVICSTLATSGGDVLHNYPHPFQALIIDEAAQAVEVSTLIPMRLKIKHVVLVGDPRQLPATVISSINSENKYERSLFERLESTGHPVTMLTMQYRMCPRIREFPSQQFYGNLLCDGENVQSAAYQNRPFHKILPFFDQFVFFNVKDGRELRRMGGGGAEAGQSTSIRNDVEANFVLSLCDLLFSSCPEVRRPGHVGVISPYKDQVLALRRRLRETRFQGLEGQKLVEVNTVDGFQGREKDIIIFSCVRTETRGSIGFLADVRRLNVAITRARHSLLLVGSAAALSQHQTWSLLLRHALAAGEVVVVTGDSVPGAQKFSGSYEELTAGGGRHKERDKKRDGGDRRGPHLFSGRTGEAHSQPPHLRHQRPGERQTPDLQGPLVNGRGRSPSHSGNREDEDRRRYRPGRGRSRSPTRPAGFEGQGGRGREQERERPESAGVRETRSRRSQERGRDPQGRSAAPGHRDLGRMKNSLGPGKPYDPRDPPAREQAERSRPRQVEIGQVARADGRRWSGGERGRMLSGRGTGRSPSAQLTNTGEARHPGHQGREIATSREPPRGRALGMRSAQAAIPRRTAGREGTEDKKDRGGPLGSLRRPLSREERDKEQEHLRRKKRRMELVGAGASRQEKDGSAGGDVLSSILSGISELQSSESKARSELERKGVYQGGSEW